MNPTLTLGRVAGIRIGINCSFLIVFALIVWTLGSRAFPAQDPHLSSGTYAAMAIVAAFRFFSSLPLHELGHAFQARREGVQIEGITLGLFGGFATFKGMRRRRHDERDRARLATVRRQFTQPQRVDPVHENEVLETRKCDFEKPHSERDHQQVRVHDNRLVSREVNRTTTITLVLAGRGGRQP